MKITIELDETEYNRWYNDCNSSPTFSDKIASFARKIYQSKFTEDFYFPNAKVSVVSNKGVKLYDPET